MEWVFFVTKPSFLSTLSTWESVLVFLQTEWTIFLCITPLILLLAGLSYLPYPRLKSTGKIVLLLVASIFLSITALLIIDNFTYNLLDYGIIRSQGIWRGAYLLLFALIFYFTYRWLFRFASNPNLQKTTGTIALVLLAFSTLAAIFGFVSPTNLSRLANAKVPTHTPNIILVGTDALDASHLPFYGYGRDTMPFLSSIVDEALLMENHFSNANNSAGSVGSIFTGKLPTRTKVSKYPDIFKGKDAYEHFPGILMDTGYRNYEITYSIYEDALTLNLKSGFHRASGVSLNASVFSRLINRFLPDTVQYFLDSLMERATDRLLHISYVRVMPDPFSAVYEPNQIEDRTGRIPELLQIIAESDQPYFAHVHLLGTHGPKYAPDTEYFSVGDTQSKDWMANYYDDAIRDFDGYMKEIFATLAKNGQLDNTMIILYTDHTRTRDTLHKIPLVIWFPGNEIKGRITSNTNNLDIGPTILDYLGLDIPEWMEGVSLIQSQPESMRPIYGVIWHKTKFPGGNPPFFEYGNFRMSICQKYVDFIPPYNVWQDGTILNHSAPCPEDELPSVREMQDLLIARIKSDGFDTTLMEQTRE